MGKFRRLGAEGKTELIGGRRVFRFREQERPNQAVYVTQIAASPRRGDYTNLLTLMNLNGPEFTSTDAHTVREQYAQKRKNSTSKKKRQTELNYAK